MSLATQLTDLTTRIATEVKALRTLINGNAADLTALDTTATNNLVTAINEVLVTAVTQAEMDDAIADAIAALVGTAPSLLDTLGEISDAIADNADFAGTMTTLLAGKQAVDATLTALAGVATAANKLIYATGSDTFATTDFTAYGRTIVAFADAAAARTSIDVYSKTEIGSPTTNFVATFEAGLV